MSGKKGMKHYPREVKIEAVRMFFKEGMTRAEITTALELRNEGRVKMWVRQYRREGVEAFNKPKGRPRKLPESEKSELERLRMENELLKKYHAELRKEVLAKRNIGLFTDTGEDLK